MPACTYVYHCVPRTKEAKRKCKIMKLELQMVWASKWMLEIEPRYSRTASLLTANNALTATWYLRQGLSVACYLLCRLCWPQTCDLPTSIQPELQRVPEPAQWLIKIKALLFKFDNLSSTWNPQETENQLSKLSYELHEYSTIHMKTHMPNLSIWEYS